MILPTIRQLQYLVALKKHGSFSRAAEACLVTQSTLSAGIRELETLLGVSVVERTKRRVMFSAFGEALLAQAKQVIGAAEDLVRLVEARSLPLTGPFKLGAIPTIGPFILTGLLPPLRELYPDLQLFLRERQTAELLREVWAGELDAALIALPFDLGGLEYEVLLEDGLLLAIEPGLVSDQAKRSVLSDRMEEMLVLEEGHCLRDHVLEACGASPGQLARSFGATSLMSLVQMVAAGVGSTLVPRLAVDAGLLHGLDVEVIDLKPEPVREVALVWRPSTTRREDFVLLANLIKEQYGST